MSQNEPELVNEQQLPALVGAPAPRPSLARAMPRAAFLSQLIAERQHLAPQRQRRRAPLGVAMDSYRTGASIAVRRLPAGYRTTLVV